MTLVRPLCLEWVSESTFMVTSSSNMCRDITIDGEASSTLSFEVDVQGGRFKHSWRSAWTPDLGHDHAKDARVRCPGSAGGACGVKCKGRGTAEYRKNGCCYSVSGTPTNLCRGMAVNASIVDVPAAEDFL